MSSTEIGFDGVWSCIYCEGTWLSTDDLKAVSAAGQTDGFSVPALTVGKTDIEERLKCPCEAPRSMVAILVVASKVNYCTSCGSMFFHKGVLKELAPHVGAGGGAPVAALKAVGSAALSAIGMVLWSGS